MSTILVSLADSAEEESVTAAYYVIEDGWVTFKTDDGKLVASYPEKRIIRIKVEKPEVNPPADDGGWDPVRVAKRVAKDWSHLDKTDDMIREIDPTWTTGK